MQHQHISANLFLSPLVCSLKYPTGLTPPKHDCHDAWTRLAPTGLAKVHLGSQRPGTLVHVPFCGHCKWPPDRARALLSPSLCNPRNPPRAKTGSLLPPLSPSRRLGTYMQVVASLLEDAPTSHKPIGLWSCIWQISFWDSWL